MDVEALAARMAGRLQSSGVASHRELRPASSDEVAELQARVGVPLPAAHQAFLRAVGHGAGCFFCGTDLFLNNLPLDRKYFEELIQEGSGGDLPPDAYVFASHQGYQFLYFVAGVDDDPPVYHHLEYEPGPKRVSVSFTDWFEQGVDDHVESADQS